MLTKEELYKKMINAVMKSAWEDPGEPQENDDVEVYAPYYAGMWPYLITWSKYIKENTKLYTLLYNKLEPVFDEELVALAESQVPEDLILQLVYGASEHIRKDYEKKLGGIIRPPMAENKELNDLIEADFKNL